MIDPIDVNKAIFKHKSQYPDEIYGGIFVHPTSNELIILYFEEGEGDASLNTEFEIKVSLIPYTQLQIIFPSRL